MIEPGNEKKLGYPEKRWINQWSRNRQYCQLHVVQKIKT